MHKVLVIIVTYNAMNWLDKCLSSIDKSTVSCDVIVVDNGSTDDTRIVIKEKYLNVQLIESDTNLGFGKANNIGLQRALKERYDYVYLLNQDAWILPDTLEKLIGVSENHPEYGILSPIQMKGDMNHLDEKFADNVIGNHQKSYPLFVDDLYFGRLEDVYEVSYVMAAHWLISRKCFEKVGGFSPTFPHYGEDDNYIERVRYWNMKCGIVPLAKAVHDRADSNWSPQKQKYISYYIRRLDAASNPLKRMSLYNVLLLNFFSIIKEKQFDALKYQIRLFKERKSIVRNYKKSLESKPFL